MLYHMTICYCGKNFHTHIPENHASGIIVHLHFMWEKNWPCKTAGESLNKIYLMLAR